MPFKRCPDTSYLRHPKKLVLSWRAFPVSFLDVLGSDTVGYMEAFPHLQETTGEQWNIGNLQGAEDTFFLKKKHVCFFFRDLAILRYTNSTRCGFMSTFVSLLNLCLDYFQVESCKLQWVPFLSS